MLRVRLSCLLKYLLTYLLTSFNQFKTKLDKFWSSQKLYGTISNVLGWYQSRLLLCWMKTFIFCMWVKLDRCHVLIIAGRRYISATTWLSFSVHSTFSTVWCMSCLLTPGVRCSWNLETILWRFSYNIGWYYDNHTNTLSIVNVTKCISVNIKTSLIYVISQNHRQIFNAL